MRQMVIITDCHDDNARMRQVVRVRAFFDAPVEFCGVKNTLQAGGMIVDALDAALGEPIIILANVAPRDDEAKKHWANGTPFGYIQIKDSWIFGTIDGYVFSLLQQIMGRPLTLNVFSIPKMVNKLGVDELTAKLIRDSQFRSYEFLPRAARKIVDGAEIPTWQRADIPAPPAAIWHTDNFGNAKTTLLADELNLQVGQTITVQVERKVWQIWRRSVYEQVPYYHHLNDAPVGTLALVIGSSGYGHRRYLELMVREGSTAKRYDLKAGSRIRIMTAGEWDELEVADRLDWAA